MTVTTLTLTLTLRPVTPGSGGHRPRSRRRPPCARGVPEVCAGCAGFFSQRKKALLVPFSTAAGGSVSRSSAGSSPWLLRAGCSTGARYRARTYEPPLGLAGGFPSPRAGWVSRVPQAVVLLLLGQLPGYATSLPALAGSESPLCRSPWIKAETFL